MTDQLNRLKTVLADRYAIGRELGRGGMAIVYLAEDLKHRRKVALKVLRPELTASLGAERFLREITTTAQLSHPNILPLYDSGEADGTLYYTMPFVEGESLRDRLNRENQLPIEDALQVTKEVADALGHAHSLGFVHRDVKPENILFQGGHAVVADFGIARAVTEAGGQRLTETGLAVGTPAYMSPEQASGGRQIDARSDLYSLACVLYEMLSGETLFTGPSARAIIAKVLSLPPTPVRMLRPRVPEGVEQAILVALDKSAVDRFATVGAFAAALEEGVKAEPEQRLPGLPGPAGRGSAWSLSKVIANATAYLLGALVLFTAIGLLTTVVYDVKMQLPAEYTPSRTDFPVVGVRAATPAIILGSAVVVVYVVLKYLMRFPVFLLRRFLDVGPALDDWVRRSTGTWRRMWGSVHSAAVAELFLVAALGASILVLFAYRRLLASLWTDDTEILSCSFRPLHESYTIAVISLLAVLAVGWIGVSRYLHRRQARGVGVAVARWGGLVWMFILVMIMTMPWRLLYQNERERALLDDERVYILVERDADLVVYNAERRSTRLYRKDGTVDLKRLNTSGYVFENAEEFAADSGC
ncbi:MAG: protein kinase [Gemmatimonadota bacterium]|nr:protein kinase [Gemmatimonadota bacterium]MDH3369117.1 protein kinase [Gemmatimonadota bacterium]MDH3479712.1 protein kinase [Gemmatimonadota bacterium]MDH5550550.1 protein kinase [Gemmatimonadota bacterium]